ncbi:hypothetical protein ES703_20549 [subsurface metagenome]
MSKCEVFKLISSLCNEECPKWSTCPIAEMILKHAISLFANYNPKQKETSKALQL